MVNRGEGGRRTTSEENKVVARRLYEVIATGNLDLAEEIVDPDVPDNERASVTEGHAQPRVIETFRQFAADAHAAFPDMQITVAEMIAEGDGVAARMIIMRATQRGEFQGIAATRKRVQVRAMDMFRIAIKIVECWGHGDDPSDILRESEHL